MKHIVIIGNGIAGVTAARFLRKKTDYKITIISSESKYFFSRPALMYAFMHHMKFQNLKPYPDDFWQKNNIELFYNHVAKVNLEDKKLLLQDNSKISYDILIFAVGSKSNKFGWPGQDLDGVQGFYSLDDLNLLNKNINGSKNKAVIVGGGLIGVELAEMLHYKHIDVTFLIREKYFWDIVLPKEESLLVTKHIRNRGINLVFNTELKKINANENKRANSVETSNDETISCSFVGLTVGVSPNIDFIQDSSLATDRGILINEYFETNIDDVYAIGDCAQFTKSFAGRRPVEQVWYTGKVHGASVAKIISGEKAEYIPGVWFNSAKFFDLEYQTYGNVLSKLPENESTLYWEDEKSERSIRIVFDTKSEKVKGFNFFGIRGKHQICEKWIKKEKKLSEIINNLAMLNFDPEFYKPFENYVVNQYKKNLNRL